ncbi:thiaminase II [Chthonobacter rhizosphaerae]|uniref:thiaminase II n=1 Tax=Chthonobacter rhizosphaerae TaxID=2735553 RepID=UPI0015EFCD94|nr:thiaminase II [Chthonobacter rhizosphaerae]
MPTLLSRLIEARPDEWRAYTHHAFVERLAAGTLPEAAFRHYLVQDYLFLIQFARAYALAVFKSRTIEEMQAGLAGLKAILDLEMDLHVRTCAGWGLTREAMAATPEDIPTTAYTRFVIDAGLQGDLLDLHVALSPCVIGYGVIAERLAAVPGALEATNPYAFWIAEYAGEAYREVAESAVRTLDRLAGSDLSPERFKRLADLFAQASRLEAAFWQMGLDAAR